MKKIFLGIQTLVFVIWFFLGPAATFGATISVPGDYATIQAGIDAASAGDTALVSPGTYQENVRMKDGVNLTGSGYASTTIDGGLETVVTCLYDAVRQFNGALHDHQ